MLYPCYVAMAGGGGCVGRACSSVVGVFSPSGWWEGDVSWRSAGGDGTEAQSEWLVPSVQ